MTYILQYVDSSRKSVVLKSSFCISQELRKTFLEIIEIVQAKAYANEIIKIFLAKTTHSIKASEVNTFYAQVYCFHSVIFAH